LTSRERVLKAIDHIEPDRVPIDLGGTITTGIMAHALDRLRKHLGLENKPVKVFEVFQMLGEVEMDIVDRFDIDVLPVYPLVQFFGLRKENYKPYKLWDGTDVLMPGQFNVEIDSGGGLLLHSEGDKKKPVVGRMPKNGYYFDMPKISKYIEYYNPPSLKSIEKEKYISNEELEFMAKRAEKLRKTTDKALILDQWESIGLDWVGSIPDFLVLLYTNKKYVIELFNIRTEVAIKNLENLKHYLKDNIDIIGLEGNDYGGQDGPFFSLEVFDEVFLPFLKIQNDWIHKNTSWKTFQHCCGSIADLLPSFVKTDVDIINPVQTSAKGMDPKWLKEQFGHRLTFWGGGVDTQKTLTLGTPSDVEEEVRKLVENFGDNGGFVFSGVHNIQAEVPIENVIAMFETIKKYR